MDCFIVLIVTVSFFEGTWKWSKRNINALTKNKMKCREKINKLLIYVLSSDYSVLVISLTFAPTLEIKYSSYEQQKATSDSSSKLCTMSAQDSPL